MADDKNTKTTKGKSKRKPSKMVSPLNGATVHNPGGPRPGSGRPPEKYRAWCAEAVNSKKAREAVEAVLSDPEHPQFSKLHAYVGQQGHGTPSQPFEEGTEKPQPVVIEFREHEEKGEA